MPHSLHCEKALPAFSGAIEFLILLNPPLYLLWYPILSLTLSRIYLPLAPPPPPYITFLFPDQIYGIQNVKKCLSRIKGSDGQLLSAKPLTVAPGGVEISVLQNTIVPENANNVFLFIIYPWCESSSLFYHHISSWNFFSKTYSKFPDEPLRRSIIYRCIVSDALSKSWQRRIRLKIADDLVEIVDQNPFSTSIDPT